MDPQVPSTPANLPAPAEEELSSSVSRLTRLQTARRRRHHGLLFLSGLLVAGVLGYAAFRIHDLTLENDAMEQDLRLLREQRDQLIATQSQGEVWRRQALEEVERKQNLERTLAALREELGSNREKSATREKELEKVIAFLREEITAAEATIRQLSGRDPVARPAETLSPAGQK